jgi:hypothetical protein
MKKTEQRFPSQEIRCSVACSINSVYKLPLCPIAEYEDRDFRQNLGCNQRDNQLLIIEVEQPVIEQQHKDYE